MRVNMELKNVMGSIFFETLPTASRSCWKQCAQNITTANMCWPYYDSYDQARIALATSIT